MDISDSDVAAALARQWALTVQDLSYLPVGFGGHHWLAAGQTGSRWFVTWGLLYVKRWLAAPVVMPDGEVRPRERRTPQGGLCAAAHKPEPPSFRQAMVIARCTWSTPSVNVLLAGLIGIAATLLGSFTTYLFQSRTAERAQAFERDERLRYEQVNACSAYATAMTELKRGLITLWFYQRRDAAGADYLATRVECDRLGASAEAARFRVQLVLGDPEVMRPADAAFTAAGAEQVC